MKRPCLDCGISTTGTRCPAHEAARLRARDRQRGGSTARGYGPDWQRYSRQAIASYRAEYGDVCRGFGRGPHEIDPRDWCTDHDVGPLCRACNSRKAATVDKQRAHAARAGGGRPATPRRASP